MKKTLLVAALFSAAVAVPAMPSMAADMAAAKPAAVEAKCFILPLLPDCVAEWSDHAQAHGLHVTTIPNAWWTCKKADAKAGHLLDCDVK